MYIAGFLKSSTVNGPSIRKVLFVQGCSIRCKDCHNKHTWEFGKGEYKTVDEVYDMITKTNSFIKNITFCGGEPFDQAEELYKLALKLKKDDYNILIYTGYYIEDILESNDEYKIKLFNIADYIIDGPFIKEFETNEEYKGSFNQRFIKKKSIIIE